MEDIRIKVVTLDNISQLQEIGKHTFHETFSPTNTEENMTLYLIEKFSVERLTAELTNRYSKFYFALIENRPIGYLKINSGEAQTEIKDKYGLEIERIYVLQEFQRKNVGQLLYKQAIKEAIKNKVDYVWLGVWEKNQKAIAFYKKNGFIEFDKHIFILGADSQTDVMMKLQLKK